MESYDAGAPEDAGQAPEQEVGGETPQGPDPNAIADTLYDELAQGYGDEAIEYEEEDYERPSVSEIAAGQRNWVAVRDKMVEEHPAIQTPAAVQAIHPIYQAMIAQDPTLEGNLELIREIYDDLGGDATFEGALVEQEYLNALPPEPGHDPQTGKPLPNTDPLTGQPTYGQPAPSNDLLTS